MISNYYDFVDEYALFQRDEPNGIGIGKTLLFKKLILMKFRQSEIKPLWQIPLKVLDEILTKCKRSKK